MKKDDIGTAYAKVYVNGVAIGAEKSTTNTSYVDKSESDLAVSVGDVIQIYGKRAGGITQCIVQEAKIQCNNPTVPQEASGY
jgi:isocitrate lyase